MAAARQQPQQCLAAACLGFICFRTVHPIFDGCDLRKSIPAWIIGKSRLILHVSHQVGLSLKLRY